MSLQEITSALEELNLNSKECAVYVSLLELGQSNVTRLSSKAGINRVSCYSILSSLINKGIVSTIEKDNIQTFIAAEPRRLIEILKEKEDKIKSVLPELDSLKERISKKPSIQLFEGKKGISTLLDNFITNSETEIIAYGNFEIAEKTIEYESLHYRKARLGKKIRTRAVTNSLKDVEFTSNKDWKNLTEIRILKSMGDLSTWAQVSKGFTAILTFKKELIGILIKNEEVSEMHKFIFDVLWKAAR